MLSNNPRNIALLDALFITLLASLIFTIATLISATFRLDLLLGFFFSVFVSSFLIIKYSIDKFFFEKIKIIYHTIGKLKTKRELKIKTKSDDVLDIVNQAVLQWSEEQKKEIAELKRMADYRREFLGNISHELKTPIFNIQGYVLTLLDGGLQDDEINVKYLKNARKSVNRLIAIVEDLEEISKFESGEIKLKKEVFDLNDLTRDVIEYMEMKARDNNTTIRLDSQSNHTYSVKADKKRIRQVLINLIDNAIKYGDKDKGKVNISIFDFHDYYLVEIKDNGDGIPEEYLFRVFERFFRTDSARSRQKGGTGLGLAIVKHIIEAHHQKISVRNNPGKGSTFAFSVRKA
jgi:two-component system phosphate regulon sensor histidine kinase PhoR